MSKTIKNKESDTVTTVAENDNKRRIVIIGATSGIGLRSAIILALAGWKVGVAGRNLEVLKKLKKRFPKSVEYERIDVASKEAPKGLEKLIKRLGGMDIYFHVAGVLCDNPDLEVEKEVTTLQTNVVGFAQMTTTAYKYYKDTKRKGQIAAITSVAGTNGIGAMASYSASKKFDQTYLTALDQLAHAQKVNVTITDIRPGWIRTPLQQAERNYPMNMTLNDAVPQILKAMLQRKRVAVIDRRWEVLYWLWRCIPLCVWTRLDPQLSTPATPDEIAVNKDMQKSEI